MGLSWLQEGPDEVRVGEEENLLRKEEVGEKPAVPALPGSLVEMHVLGPWPGSTESEPTFSPAGRCPICV